MAGLWNWIPALWLALHGCGEIHTAVAALDVGKFLTFYFFSFSDSFLTFGYNQNLIAFIFQILFIKEDLPLS
jgi:hypothetical protein